MLTLLDVTCRWGCVPRVGLGMVDEVDDGDEFVTKLSASCLFSSLSSSSDAAAAGLNVPPVSVVSPSIRSINSFFLIATAASFLDNRTSSTNVSVEFCM